jgi:hypothetical protein
MHRDDERSWSRRIVGSRCSSYCFLKSLVYSGALDFQSVLLLRSFDSEKLDTRSLAMLPILMISRSDGLESPDLDEISSSRQRGASSAKSGARWSRQLSNLGKSRLLHQEAFDRYIAATFPVLQSSAPSSFESDAHTSLPLEHSTPIVSQISRHHVFHTYIRR